MQNELSTSKRHKGSQDPSSSSPSSRLSLVRRSTSTSICIHSRPCSYYLTTIHRLRRILDTNRNPSSDLCSVVIYIAERRKDLHRRKPESKNEFQG
ncbi:hypothetical protein L2E82_26975 [Cichorium intybus]|uniref:Uncharacterized protein n=1 Tax=Cichorium intybus TaxID=13427 RepID=A0ACB9CS33_CICIN|nr:hypothetical protein L2E82_26975 [Cichorium intybus]